MMSLKRKLCRSEVVRNEGERDRSHGNLVRGHDGERNLVRGHDRERNLVRGHALFVRFMERKYLGDCVHYFPASMTLGQLRVTTPRDLVNKYNIRASRDRDRIMRIIEESHQENAGSDIDVSTTKYI